jgi:hypothetical protein
MRALWKEVVKTEIQPVKIWCECECKSKFMFSAPWSSIHLDNHRTEFDDYIDYYSLIVTCPDCKDSKEVILFDD